MLLMSITTIVKTVVELNQSRFTYSYIGQFVRGQFDRFVEFCQYSTFVKLKIFPKFKLFTANLRPKGYNLNIFVTKFSKNTNIFGLYLFIFILKYLESNFNSICVKKLPKVLINAFLSMIIKAPTQIRIIGQFVRFVAKSQNFERTNWPI